MGNVNTDHLPLVNLQFFSSSGCSKYLPKYVQSCEWSKSISLKTKDSLTPFIDIVFHNCTTTDLVHLILKAIKNVFIMRSTSSNVKKETFKKYL